MQWLQNLAMKFQRFMAGRYGGDQLNLALLLFSFLLTVVCSFFPYGWIGSLVALLLLALTIFRMFSRNTTRRFAENYRFLKLWNPVKSWFQWLWLSIRYCKKNRYFLCPKCRRIASVPKGTGHVTITCKGCKHKYDKKA